MRVALYARVSTGEQTCETQLYELRQHVDRRGWTPVDEYTDQAVSGATRHRDELNRCLRDAKAGRFSLVLVWRLDRLGRTLVDLLQLVAELRRHGVGFASVREPMLDTSSPAGELIFAIFGALAQFERDLIADRTRAGMARARASGVHVGAPRKALDEQLARELVERTGYARTARSLGISESTLRRRLRPG